MKQYVYFFTRQDMIPEQQIVQTAHVALKLGVKAGKKLNPDETYFTVVGVRNEEALLAVQRILDAFKFDYEVFFEPDLPGITSVATYPIDEDKRDVLMAFNLLKL